MLFTPCLYLLSSVMLSVPTTPSSAPYTQPNLCAISCVGSVLNLRACTRRARLGVTVKWTPPKAVHTVRSIWPKTVAPFLLCSIVLPCAILFYIVHSFIGKNRGKFPPVTEGARLLRCEWEVPSDCLHTMSEYDSVHVSRRIVADFCKICLRSESEINPKCHLFF